MTDTPSSKALTESLLTVIRQQRHYGTRVIISTQEPTISPQLIDLCSITVIHRFSSPEWFGTLRRHVSAFDTQEDSSGGTQNIFKMILNLGIGQVLVFAPTAIVRMADVEKASMKMRERLLEVRMRRRVTWDGGRSVVCL